MFYDAQQLKDISLTLVWRLSYVLNTRTKDRKKNNNRKQTGRGHLWSTSQGNRKFKQQTQKIDLKQAKLTEL